MNVLWAKSEVKRELPVDFEFGKKYYLKCSVGWGILVGRPKIKFIGNKQGEAEYRYNKNK